MVRKVVLKLEDSMYSYLKTKSEEKKTTIEDYIKGCIATVGCMDILSELAKLEHEIDSMKKS